MMPPVLQAVRVNDLSERRPFFQFLGRSFHRRHDFISRSAVERIFIATNGETKGGCQNPQRQGLGAALLDGHRPNNTFGGIPTTATDYSPVWDANVYEWTEELSRYTLYMQDYGGHFSAIPKAL